MLALLAVILLNITLISNAAPEKELKKPQLFSTQDLLQAQKNASAWAASTVKTTGKESVLIANLLFTSYMFATTDNTVRKQLSMIARLAHAHVLQLRDYVDSEYRNLLIKLLEQQKELLATQTVQMDMWQSCNKYIESISNNAVINAVNNFQKDAQDLLNSHLSLHNCTLNKNLSDNEKACMQDGACLLKVAELAQLMSTDKLPEECNTDQNDILPTKAHVMNKLSRQLEEIGANVFVTAHELSKTAINMQDVSCILFALYYNALHAAMNKAGYSKNAYVMFNEKGLIPAQEKHTLLPESLTTITL